MDAFFFSSRRRHTRSLCDWSSDVCSSDLATCGWTRWALRSRTSTPSAGGEQPKRTKIGRASCRERVEIWGVAGLVKKKKNMRIVLADMLLGKMLELIIWLV